MAIMTFLPIILVVIGIILIVRLIAKSSSKRSGSLEEEPSQWAFYPTFEVGPDENGRTIMIPYAIAKNRNGSIGAVRWSGKDGKSRLIATTADKPGSIERLERGIYKVTYLDGSYVIMGEDVDGKTKVLESFNTVNTRSTSRGD
jgi:hypothetical protein